MLDIGMRDLTSPVSPSDWQHPNIKTFLGPARTYSLIILIFIKRTKHMVKLLIYHNFPSWNVLFCDRTTLIWYYRIMTSLEFHLVFHHRKKIKLFFPPLNSLCIISLSVNYDSNTSWIHLTFPRDDLRPSLKFRFVQIPEFLKGDEKNKEMVKKFSIFQDPSRVVFWVFSTFPLRNGRVTCREENIKKKKKMHELFCISFHSLLTFHCC